MDLFGIVGPLGSIIGNCLLAATGLAFAVGSNVSVRHRTARWFWMACWALFLSYYCGVVIEEWLRPGAYLEPDTRLWLTVVGDAGSIASGPSLRLRLPDTANSAEACHRLRRITIRCTLACSSAISREQDST